MSDNGSDGPKPWAGTCPYCGQECQQLNNHIRLSTGEHGEHQQYPGDWDKESRERVENPAEPQGENGGNGGSEPTGGSQTEPGGSDGTAGSPAAPESGQQPSSEAGGEAGGTTVGPDDEPGSEPTDGSDGDAAPLEFSDTLEDTRTYNCGECDTEVPYLENCPEGHELVWQGVTA